jgi:hypothetical protein
MRSIFLTTHPGVAMGNHNYVAHAIHDVSLNYIISLLQKPLVMHHILQPWMNGIGILIICWYIIPIIFLLMTERWPHYYVISICFFLQYNYRKQRGDYSMREGITVPYDGTCSDKADGISTLSSHYMSTDKCDRYF